MAKTPVPQFVHEDWQMPEETRKAKPKRPFIQPGSFADSPFGKIVLLGIILLGLVFITTLMFLASGEGAAFWYYAWMGLAQFLIPSSTGNGYAVIATLAILIDMFFSVKVIIGTETYRCRGNGKDNGRVWRGRTWIGGWELMAHSRMTIHTDPKPGDEKPTIHERFAYGRTGFNEITFVQNVHPVRDSKNRRITFYRVPTRVHFAYPTMEQYKEIVRQTTSRKRSIFTAQENVGRPFNEAMQSSKQVVG
jgi:hypothetical protein